VSGVTRHSKKVRFYSTVDLVNALEHEKLMNKPGRMAQSLAQLDLVVLDELGYLPFSQAGGRCCFTCCPNCTSTPECLEVPR